MRGWRTSSLKRPIQPKEKVDFGVVCDMIWLTLVLAKRETQMANKNSVFFKKQDTLPDTLSGLLRVAVKDCRKAAKTKNVKFDMGRWFDSEGAGCYVCMAGAVMRGSLGVKTASVRAYNKKGHLLTPGSFRLPIGNKLRAINALRTGDVRQAALELAQSLEAYVETWAIVEADQEALKLTDGSGGGSQDWEMYDNMADMLESKGL